MVKYGYVIEFESESWVAMSFSHSSFSKKENDIITKEIDKLVNMEGLSPVKP